MCEIDTRVHLRRRQRGVSEELLNRPQIHPGLEEVGGESVPKGVRVEPVEIRSAIDGGGEDAPDRAIRQTATALIDEERVVVVAGLSTPSGAVGKIVPDCRRRVPTEGDYPFLPALAANAEQPLGEGEIVEIGCDQLTHPETGAVEQLDDGEIAAARGAVGEGLEKFLDGVAVDDLWL